MDLIGESLVAETEEPGSPPWHGEVITERVTELASGEAKFLTLDEAKDRLDIHE